MLSRLFAKESFGVAGWYFFNALLSLAILIFGLELWKTSPREPWFYSEDSLLHFVFAQNVLETGTYYASDRMAAPDRLDLRWFPQSDGINYLEIRLLGLIDADPFFVLNLHFLLGFPLAASSALLAYRRFGGSFVCGSLCAQLFAFLPYHMQRCLLMGHVFLGAYWLVPLATLLLLRVYHGEAIRPWRWLAFSFIFASGGVYYAFFFCFFLCVATLRAGLVTRRLGPVCMGIVLLSATVAGGLANFAPSLSAKVHRETNLVQRSPYEADLYGLRIYLMLTPPMYHRLEALEYWKTERLRAAGDTWNENESASLGIIGTLGFLLLLSKLLTGNRSEPDKPDLLHALSTLTIVAILLATAGGFGTLLSYCGFSWIRGYNRISIFLAFFALLALVLTADRLTQRTPRPAFRWAANSIWIGLTILGLWDQTGTFCKLGANRWSEEFQRDRAFVQAMERELPPNAKVFQLPVVPFPERRMPSGECGYYHAVPYLHSKSLFISYGPAAHQATYDWQEKISRMPPREMVATLRRQGFAAIWIDHRGYGDEGDWGRPLKAELTDVLGRGPAIRQGGACCYFSLVESTPPTGPGPATGHPWP
jgi:hypothetical protein